MDGAIFNSILIENVIDTVFTIVRAAVVANPWFGLKE